MKKRFLAVLIALFIAIALPAYSEYMSVHLDEVPVERLLKNLQDYLDKHPKEAEAHYTFGRICSMAYARSAKTLPVELSNGQGKIHPYPRMGIMGRYPKQEALAKPDEKPSPRKIEYLRLAIEHYHAATTLNAKDVYSWLGYAWMVEQGMKYADTLSSPFDSKGTKVPQSVWREEALNAYRKVYTKTPKEALDMDFPDPVVEAGVGILRLQKAKGAVLALKEREEVASIENNLPKLRKRGGFITPIILPLTSNASFQRLTATPKRVSFDMMGDGIRRRWSWVTPDAGFLVWNPKRNGRVTSGYQLFGTVTWCIMWKSGYEPLARLDNDKNGWLEGRELEGIGVWQDKNGNGVCDTGEVLTLTQLGIARIAVRGHRKIGGVLSNPQGIVKRDGSTLPTFDWISKTP